MWTFCLILIYSYPETYVHFPSCSGIFVHPWVLTTKPFPFWFYSLYSCPDRLAIPQDPSLCPQDAAASAPCTGSTCSSSRSLHTFFPPPGGVASLPQLQKATVSPQLWRLSLFCHLWISHQQLIKQMFQVVKSLFQWLLCDSDQPSVLWYLISACILLPSRLTSSEATCLLWVSFLHWACVYWAFTLCQTWI